MRPSRSLSVPVVLVLAAAALSFPRVARGADPTAAALEDQIRAVRGDVMERREAAFKVLLPMTPEEAKAFRPLRDQYDDELKRHEKDRQALLREYLRVSATMSPEQARDFAGRSLKLDEDRAALRRRYFELMAAQVSPVIAAKYLQLQRQFETMLDFQVQSMVPLVP